MTYEINNDFDQIILNSTNLVNTNQMVTLTVTKNCESTTTIDVDTAATLIELVPADLSQEDLFQEGPYYFKLEVKQDDGTIVKEYLCRYIQPDACTYIDLYKTTADLEKVLAHQALLQLNECEQCSCTDACLFYETLNNTNCDDCTCGCSGSSMSLCGGSCQIL